MAYRRRPYSTGARNRRASVSQLLKLVLAVGVCLAITRHGAGVAISTFYSPEVFRLAGFTDTTVELLGTVGVGAVYLAVGLLGLWLVERSGRRSLMLIGLVGMTVSLATLGGVFLLPQADPLVAWMAPTALLVFVASFMIGPGVVVFLLISELFPLRVRGLGMGLAHLALWATYVVSALTFLMLLNVAGNSGTFFIYTGFAAASWLFVYRLVPETRGRTLEEIEADWRETWARDT